MKTFRDEIFVTRPLVPRFSSRLSMFNRIFSTRNLTNFGPVHEELETTLQSMSGARHLSLWNNGTIALLTGLSQLDLSGEVIVTPFTFPATVHALNLLGLKPVFVDVKSDDWTINPEAIGEAITSRTTAILATHIYGNLCDHEGLWQIAQRNGLRLVFDGAHMMGRDLPWFPESESLVGDFTMLSFHATKLFHTVEGGALVTNSLELDRRFRMARNFGITGEDQVAGFGINGKLSEVHSAIGLAVIPMVEREVQRRRRLSNIYANVFEGVDGIKVMSGQGQRTQYLSVRIDSLGENACRDCVWTGLRREGVRSRRYFYPLMSEVKPYSGTPLRFPLTNAELAVRECLVLPLHGDLTPRAVERIARGVVELMSQGCECQ